MIRGISFSLFLAGIAFALSLNPNDAEGCAGVRRPQYPPIVIAEESAIIVWDSVNKVEHFIRRADFDTKAPDFGFLVPTPGPGLPKLTETSDSLFGEIDQWIKPKIVDKNKYDFGPVLCFCLSGCGAGKGSKTAAAPGVRVLGEQKVGGYETAILEADNTDALSKWLKDNKYSSDPELQSWLAPYVGAKWRITAFKISQDPKTGQLATTKPVRMSFKTERPFFPYREPEYKPEKKDIDPGNTKQENKHVPTEIDGIWKVESAEGNDVADLADRKGTGSLPGTRFHFVDGVVVGRYLKDRRYTVDASKEPKGLVVSKMPGIYKLDGDTLHWCQGKTERPGRFDAKEGLLLVLHRDRKAEADEAARTAEARDWERLHGGKRLLRVHFVSATRMDGKLGNAAWHAKIPFADQLTDEQRKQIAKETGIAENDLPANAWLTTFEDRADPRPGKDEVYFDPAQDQTPIRPPDFIRYADVHIPIDCVVVCLLIVGIPLVTVIVQWRRKKAA